MVWIDSSPSTVQLPQLYAKAASPKDAPETAPSDEREELVEEAPLNASEVILSVADLGKDNIGVLTKRSVYLYQKDPLVCVSAHVRSDDSIAHHGYNVAAKPISATRFLVSTSESYLLVYQTVALSNHNQPDALLVYSGTNLIQTGYPLHDEHSGWFGIIPDHHERTLLSKYIVLQRALKVGMGIDAFWGNDDTIVLVKYAASMLQVVNLKDKTLNAKIAIDSLAWYISAGIAQIVAESLDGFFLLSTEGDLYHTNLAMSGVKIGHLSCLGSDPPVMTYNSRNEVLLVAHGGRVEFIRYEKSDQTATHIATFDCNRTSPLTISATVQSVGISPNGETCAVHLSNGHWLLTSKFGLVCYDSAEAEETVTGLHFLDDFTLMTIGAGISVFPLRQFESSSVKTVCSNLRTTVSSPMLFRSRNRFVIVYSFREELSKSVRIPECFLKNPVFETKLSTDGLKLFISSGSQMMMYSMVQKKWYTYKQDYLAALNIVGMDTFHKFYLVLLHRKAKGDELIIFNVKPLFLGPKHPEFKDEFSSELVVWRYDLPSPLVSFHLSSKELSVVLRNNLVYNFKLEIAYPEKDHLKVSNNQQLVIRNNKILKPHPSVVDFASVPISAFLPTDTDKTTFVFLSRGKLYLLRQAAGPEIRFDLKVLKDGVESLQLHNLTGSMVSFLAHDGWHILTLEQSVPLIIPVEDHYPLFFSAQDYSLHYYATSAFHLAVRDLDEHKMMVLNRFSKQLLLGFVIDWHIDQELREDKPGNEKAVLLDIPGDEKAVSKLDQILTTYRGSSRLKVAFEILLVKYISSLKEMQPRIPKLISIMNRYLSRLQYYEITIDGLRKLEVTHEAPGKSGKLTYKRFFGFFFDAKTPSEVLADLVAQYESYGSNDQYKVLITYFMIYLNYEKDLKDEKDGHSEDFVLFSVTDHRSLQTIWNKIVSNRDWESGLEFIMWLKKIVSQPDDKQFLATLIAQVEGLQV
ncbi:hypothetical protein BABINDRAFT_183566 [Babjeviella inositovora NRRL Y-12698]|uniref:Ribosome control protein 1 domain-containing protein n=1 Tax=Babjeviella inositovora NRRL Y-12698 TaxID=984486 RepID=A0A1E3QPF3_9ASCO|nr:uncharacterized protein BABINDRAFT_183566 [Babjeviella inositovora NRRL Y-12698]ODQ79589.1 hypothetical protein BABINDRAFT_183566 [Babjeviella inositovora NRRL Y-12698]